LARLERRAIDLSRDLTGYVASVRSEATLTQALDLAARGSRLRVDSHGAQVRRRFGEAGIACILVKGRTFADLLYDAHEVRTYGDTDLLIAPTDVRRAERILVGLGFASQRIAGADIAPEPLHATPWLRPRDGAAIDLHWRLRGSRAPAEEVWICLSERAEEAVVAGAPALVLDPAAVALVCALHVAQHSLDFAKPTEDLDRAISRLPGDTWAAAAELADRIGASEAFTDGLRLHPSAAALADRLGLGRRVTLGRELNAVSAPWSVTAIQWLADHERPADRIRFAWRVVFPVPTMLRLYSRLARRGGLGLVVAYAVRPFKVAARAPAAYLRWRRISGERGRDAAS
jgi:Uncharacterised nucleotidyltransferase